MQETTDVGLGITEIDFLSGGGEMGARIRAKDWSRTSLGPIESWPHSLRTTVSICLASDLPICIIWGPDLVQIYNDGYRVICGEKHPRSMGQNFAECWREAWPVIGDAHDSALAGDTAFLENQHIFLERHGYVEECFFTFSFSPIRDESGRVVGLFHPVIEMTAKMLGERRTRALREVAARTANAKTVHEACAFAAQSLSDQELDVPFALMYVFDGVEASARLVASSGIRDSAEGHAMSYGIPKVWPLAEVPEERHGVVVEQLGALFEDFRCGPYPESPREAVALPLVLPGGERPVGVLIAGVSGRLKLNQAYRDFYELLGAAVTTAVASGRAFEEERKRADALAELDRAKTAFFSNVSHEFRTPLTLMLGPLEELKAQFGRSSSAGILPEYQQLDLVQRNALRLLKLVNTLLDFSRIEAGRVHARYEITDLASLTAELASVFRSAIEKAGLRLIIDCPSLHEEVYVDREMWEKIVLNLLSNAFKFTLKGEIEVSLKDSGAGHAERGEQSEERVLGNHVLLSVRDTGSGITPDQLGKIFERFHRVPGAEGRTHEGTGIGLALVQELARLHGGVVSVDSLYGKGSTFHVSIPFGKDHLPHKQVDASRSPAPTALGVAPFVEEALRWLPEEHSEELRVLSTEREYQDTQSIKLLGTRHAAHSKTRPLVLVADDNADMRQYIARLLAERYAVKVASNGEAALAVVREESPDLVLSDVMMPRLDGFGLLHALREDPATKTIPVILLSARAGEESRIEGLEEGADDYLIKPFSARELLAKVTSHLNISRVRKETQNELEQRNGELTRLRLASLNLMKDAVEARRQAEQVSVSLRESEERLQLAQQVAHIGTFELNIQTGVNVWTPELEMMHGLAPGSFARTQPAWENLLHPDDRQAATGLVRQSCETGLPTEGEWRVVWPDGSLYWLAGRWQVFKDETGKPLRVSGVNIDITERKKSEMLLAEQKELLEFIATGRPLKECLVALADIYRSPATSRTGLCADGQCRADGDGGEFHGASAAVVPCRHSRCADQRAGRRSLQHSHF